VCNADRSSAEPLRTNQPISDSASIRALFKRVGSFDALICAACA